MLGKEFSPALKTCDAFAVSAPVILILFPTSRFPESPDATRPWRRSSIGRRDSARFPALVRHPRSSNRRNRGFHETCLERILVRESGQRFVQREKIVVRFRHRELTLDPVATLLTAAMAQATFSSRRLDQDPPHGLRGRPEEMAAILPACLRMVAHQSQIRFMHKGRRAEGKARRSPAISRFARPEFIVDEWK